MHNARQVGVHGLPDGEANHDLETKTVWFEGRVMTIGEYVEYMQPDVYSVLRGMFKLEYREQPVDELTWEQRRLARIMTERPKPGRGGLLPGEVEP